MSLSDLLLQARPALLAQLAAQPYSPPEGLPATTLFFSLSSGRRRAHVLHVSAPDVESAWEKGAQLSQAWQTEHGVGIECLRVDAVIQAHATTWEALNKHLALTKRNYFRYGLALDAGMKFALLEQELNANAILYAGSDTSHAQLNPGNLAVYAKQRFAGQALPEPTPDAAVYVLTTLGVFVADPKARAVAKLPGGPGPHLLPPPDTSRALASWRSKTTLYSGRRQTSPLQPDLVMGMITSSAQFLARQVKDSGQFIYGHFPCFGREIPTYNSLRHASTVYSMLEAWELTRDDEQLQAIQRALGYLANTLVRHYPQADGSVLSFNVDINGEIKLGANAVSLLALVKHDELTGDTQYRPLMAQLAQGIVHMQNAETGGFVHVLNSSDLSHKEAFRIVYYDGEAAFGLMRLYGLTQDPRWLATVEKAFGHFIQVNHWQHHDHWLSYCANELTRYRPEERYFRFGVQNISNYLGFILTRETTYPTLLELSMAFHAMLQRIKAELPADVQERVLTGLKETEFYRALHHRADYLANGFFWPEWAMYYAKPKSILGSLFIRHHSFRVRIDDIEHYLSGYVAYWKMLQKSAPRTGSKLDLSPTPPPSGPVVAWGGDVNLGRRQHYRTAELGADNVLRIPALTAADLRIVNLECVIATQGEQGVRKGENGPYYYRARPEMTRVLTAAGIDMVATANNHCGDYGPEALQEQARWLDAAGIAHTGSGEHREAAFTPAIRRAGNLDVALFSIDATQPRFAAKADEPGSAHLSLNDTDAWKKELAPRIAAARRHADVVLVAVHWGDNLAKEPSPAETAVGHALIEAGADAVLGASAHVLQGIEVHQGRPILYDAGDLLFDSVRSTLGQGGVFRLEISEHGVERVVFVPVGIGFGFSEQLTGSPALEATQHYADSCKTLGCHLKVTHEGHGYVDLTPPRRQTPPQKEPAAQTHRVHNTFDPALRASPAWQVTEVPPDARIEPVRLGPLTLVGVRIKPTEITRRRMLWVESFWQCDAPVDEDIRLNIRGVPVRATTMRPWGEAMDHDPCDWMMPTTRWQPGVIYRDYYGLRPPYLKDWKNVDLQLMIGIVSKLHKAQPITLPKFIHLAVLGKDEHPTPAPASEPLTTCAASTQHTKHRPTWTAEQIEEVTGGQWLTYPPKGWFARSIVIGVKHLDMRPGPTIFVGHDSHDRARHENSKPSSKNIDRHAVIPGNAHRLAGAIVRNADIQAKLPKGFPLLRVDDPIQALIELGKAARRRYNGHVFAVTGTEGKSTTVSLLENLLGGPERVMASMDNFNTRVGVPGALANLSPDHFAAVLEVAQSALWMKRGPITHMARPTVSILLSISPAHMEKHKSIADLVRCKSKIFEGAEANSAAIINRDITHFEIAREIAEINRRRVITYGEHPESDFQLTSYHPEESTFTFSVNQRPFSANIATPGKHIALNSLAAIAALHGAGLEWISLLPRLKTAGLLPEGRGEPIKVPLRLGEATFLNHSYNANPASVKAALDMLYQWPVPAGTRKIAVLADMLELGDESPRYHREIAEYLREGQLDLVILVGELIRAAVPHLPKHLNAMHLSNVKELFDLLPSVLQPGDVVMLKGSNGTGLQAGMNKFLASGTVASAATPSNAQAQHPLVKPEANSALTLRALISGKVQGVGYRNWLQELAQKQTVSGWVRNLADGQVEALLCGPRDTVRQLVQTCRKGPPAARVDQVSWTEQQGQHVESGFEIIANAQP